MSNPLFREHIYVPQDEEFISSHVEVYADADGYFITVETDSYDAAMMTLPVAKRLLPALQKAIEAAEAHRKLKVKP